MHSPPSPFPCDFPKAVGNDSAVRGADRGRAAAGQWQMLLTQVGRCPIISCPGQALGHLQSRQRPPWPHGKWKEPLFRRPGRASPCLAAPVPSLPPGQEEHWVVHRWLLPKQLTRSVCKEEESAMRGTICQVGWTKALCFCLNAR